MSNVSKTSNMLSLVTFRCSLEDGMTALAAYLSVSRYQVKPFPERASPAKPFTPSIISYKLKAFLRLSFQEHIWCSSWPRYIFQEPLHLLRQKCLKQNPGKGWTITDQNYHKLSSNYRSRRQLEAVYGFKIGWHARACGNDMHQSPHKMARSWRLRLPSAWDHPSTFSVAQLGLGISSESGQVSLRSCWQVGHCHRYKPQWHQKKHMPSQHIVYDVFISAFHFHEPFLFRICCLFFHLRRKAHTPQLWGWGRTLAAQFDPFRQIFSWPRFLVSRIFTSKLGRFLTIAGITILLLIRIIVYST